MTDQRKLTGQTLMGEALISTHGEGLQYLLRTAAARVDWQRDPFASELLLVLCMPVVRISRNKYMDTSLMENQIIESIANPNVDVHPWLEIIAAQRDASLPIHSIKFIELAKLRDYLRSPHKHESGIRQAYQRLGMDLQLLRRIFASMHLFTERVQAQTQGLYSFVLSYGVVLNTILRRVFEPNSELLSQEAEAMVDSVLLLAKDSLRFRPIGSSASATMLLAVWPCSPARRSQIEELLEEMLTDFPIANWRTSAEWLDDALNHHALNPDSMAPFPSRTCKSAACNVM